MKSLGFVEEEQSQVDFSDYSDESDFWVQNSYKKNGMKNIKIGIAY